MRIMRSDDEQIVSAQGRYQYGHNNIYHNQQNNSGSAYDADVDFSYSGRQFMNELAKDRQFGTGNIRPVERERGSISERMYQDAIEEASRVKTMGYYNDLSKIEGTNPLHNTIPGRLREKAGIHHQTNEIQNKTNIQKTNYNVNNFNNVKDNNIGSNINNNNCNINNNNSNINKDNSNINNNYFNTPVKNNNMMSFGNKETIPPNLGMQNNQQSSMNVGRTSFQNNPMYQGNLGLSSSIAVNMNKPGEYDALMEKVRDNIQHEIETQMVEESREKLREKYQVQANNLPYKKTKEYTGGSFGKRVAAQQLQVRDYKVDKSDIGDGESNDENKVGIMSWICTAPFMIAPLIGFIVSGVISYIVPEDKTFRMFARFCLTIHMVMSLVAVYMYMKGYLDISLVKKLFKF